MTPAAIYARYSSDLQSDRSIEDQVTLCRDWALSNGYDVVRLYDDRAMSGSRFHDRMGLMRLLRDAKARGFAAVIVEHGDRLSRHPGDIHDIRDALNFAGVTIQQVSGGELDSLKASVSGLVSSIMLSGMVDKIRRGMQGRVRDGLHAGGRAYGYRPVKGEPGRMEIVEPEAQVVRRIFADFLGGKSPRLIAGELNRDGIAPPRGSRWNASTINGWGQRGNGILGNELYAGVIVWNKVHMARDPESRRRVSRANPRHLWVRSEAPALAVVSRAQFDAAQERRRGPGAGGYTRAPRHLLSGLLACPCCGGGMSVHDRSAGRIRIRCTRLAESGDCENRGSYYLDRIEAAVIEGMVEHLGHDEAAREYVRAYNTELRRLARDRAGNRSETERRLATVAADLDRAVGLLIAGTVSAETMGPKIAALESEKRRLAAEQADYGEPPVVHLNTSALARFRAMLADLRAAVATLAARAPEHLDAFRRLVARVTVHRDYTIEVSGSLTPLLGGAPGSGRALLTAPPMEFVFRRVA